MNSTTPADVKSAPIPTRFEGPETDFLVEAASVTGLSKSEIIRRAVRLLKRQKQIVQSYSFVLELAA